MGLRGNSGHGGTESGRGFLLSPGCHGQCWINLIQIKLKYDFRKKVTHFQFKEVTVQREIWVVVHISSDNTKKWVLNWEKEKERAGYKKRGFWRSLTPCAEFFCPVWDLLLLCCRRTLFQPSAGHCMCLYHQPVQFGKKFNVANPNKFLLVGERVWQNDVKERGANKL